MTLSRIQNEADAIQEILKYFLSIVVEPPVWLAGFH